MPGLPGRKRTPTLPPDAAAPTVTAANERRSHAMSHPLRVKVCGVTTSADLAAAVRAGADLVGLNFYPPSPRFVTAETAAALLAELPSAVEPVAVCVQEPCAVLAERLRPLPRRPTLQWHGTDPPTADQWDGPLIVAFPVRDVES